MGRDLTAPLLDSHDDETRSPGNPSDTPAPLSVCESVYFGELGAPVTALMLFTVDWPTSCIPALQPSSRFLGFLTLIFWQVHMIAIAFVSPFDLAVVHFDPVKKVRSGFGPGLEEVGSSPRTMCTTLTLYRSEDCAPGSSVKPAQCRKLFSYAWCCDGKDPATSQQEACVKNILMNSSELPRLPSPECHATFTSS